MVAGLSGCRVAKGFRGEELVHQFLFRKLHRLHHVGQLKPVDVHAGGKTDVRVLGNLEGLDGQVHHFLAVFGEEDDPARIALVHDVRVIVQDVQGARHGPVGDSHGHGKAHGRYDGQDFMHEHESLGTGRRVDPGAGGAGPGDAADGRVLRFHGDEFGVDSSVGDDVGEVLGNVGLGGDGIHRRHVDIAERHGFGCRDGHFHSNSLCHAYSSSTIVMAPGQHSWAQIPQPLQ